MSVLREKRLLAFALGTVWIWMLFLPRWSTRGLGIEPAPPVLLFAALLFVATLEARACRLGAAGRWALALLLVLLALLQFAAAAVEQILDRPLDLYFDLRHVPNLIALYRDAAGPRGAILIGVGALGLALVLWLSERALLALRRGMAAPRVRAAALAVGILGLLAPIVPGTPVDAAALRGAWRQASTAWRAYAALHGLDPRYSAALETPLPPAGPLPGLKGKDVYLIFIESYGTVALDDPGYRAALDPALDAFAETVGKAGYHLLSSRLVSPVYGGGSWLAHGTLASGLKLDPLLNALLLNSRRMGLPRYLAAAGYRTVEVMPGIKQPDPDADFWGFDRHYFAAELGYDGPPFGWFGIPDQFTLQRFAARELKPGHKPLFAQIVLVSSHTPFTPVPPYLGDWRDAGAFKSVPDADWQRIYAPPADWNDLDPYYLASISYDLKTLGAWLAQRDNDALIVILGDHEPPELTRGVGQPWTVPVYVLSRDEDLVAPFRALGYAPGAAPPPADHPDGMENFLAAFLNGYARAPLEAQRQSPLAPAASLP